MNIDIMIAVVLVQEGCNTNELAAHFDLGRADSETLMRQVIRNLDTQRRNERIMRDRNDWDKQVAKLRLLSAVPMFVR